MATHAAMPARQRPREARARTPVRHRHTAMAWAVPLLLGVIYGFYAVFIRRDGGPVTGGQVALGFAAGVGFAALCFALARFEYAVPRGVRAMAYGALTASSIGFLVSLTDTSVLRSTILGLAVGVPVALGTFYFFYAREDWPEDRATDRTTGTVYRATDRTAHRITEGPVLGGGAGERPATGASTTGERGEHDR